MFIGNLSYVHVAIVIVLDVFNSTVREINIFKLNLFSSYSSIKAHPSVDKVFLNFHAHSDSYNYLRVMQQIALAGQVSLHSQIYKVYIQEFCIV